MYNVHQTRYLISLRSSRNFVLSLRKLSPSAVDARIAIPDKVHALLELERTIVGLPDDLPVDLTST